MGYERRPKPPIDCAEALKRSALLPSGRTSSVVCLSIRFPYFTLAQVASAAQPRDQRENFLEHLSRHRDLGHLERDLAPVADDLRADLDQLLAQAGE